MGTEVHCFRDTPSALDSITQKKAWKKSGFLGSLTYHLVYSSSFRRPTLLASPTPKYCFKGVGKAGPKNEGEAEIVFFINFHAIFDF